MSPLTFWRSVLVQRIGARAVFGTHEGEYLEQVVGGFDDLPERRHRADHIVAALARIPLRLQRVAAERDQTEQRVVVALVHPHTVGQGWAHAAAATAAV